MTAPALARGKNGRRYVWPPNTETPELVVPSVTTILGNLSKPALVNWAAQEVASYAVENMLAWEDLPADDAIDLLKRAPYRNMTRKGNIGSAVHAAIEAKAAKKAVEVDETLLPYVDGALQYLVDHVARIIHLEATVFNRLYEYAGTVDAIIKLNDGRLAVADWKTGRNLYPEVALQLQAYARGDFIGLPDGIQATMPPIDIGVAVHLPGDGTYTAKEVPLSGRLFKTFGALRTLQAWKDTYEADCFGEVHTGGTDMKVSA